MLYRLPELLRWVAAGRRIWLCEGAKDAERILELGECATTNPAGAGNFKPEQAASLAGAHVVVVLDHDLAGYRRGLRLAGLLVEAASLRLVLPLTALEIMLAKIASNALVVVICTWISLVVVVKGALGVPLSGSMGLFLAVTALYLFASTALGIFLATLARSTPQFGLLAIPVIIPMLLLSGGSTPLDSMPQWLQWVMQGSPSTHFVSLGAAILFRDAGWTVVWPDILALAVIGLVFFGVALARFRRSLAS